MRGPRKWISGLVTLFVDNLPKEMCKEWLTHIFKFEGEVADACVSHKRRRFARDSFGFIRFKFKKEALRAMNHLDDLVIHDHKIQVSIARFSKENQLMRSKISKPDAKVTTSEAPSKAFKDGKNYKEVLQNFPRKPKLQPSEVHK